MEPDESEESDDSSDSVQETVQARTEEGGEVGIENEDEDEDEDGFGDEFDEFEAGEEDEDFGDFDQGVQSPGELQHAESAKPTLVPVDTAFVSRRILKPWRLTMRFDFQSILMCYGS